MDRAPGVPILPAARVRSRRCAARLSWEEVVGGVRISEHGNGGVGEAQPRALGPQRHRPRAQPLGQPRPGAPVRALAGGGASRPADRLDLAYPGVLAGALPGGRPEPPPRPGGRAAADGRLGLLLLPGHLQEGRPRGRRQRQRPDLQPPRRPRRRHRRPPLPREHPALRRGEEARGHERRQPGLARPRVRRPQAPQHRRRPPLHRRRAGAALRAERQVGCRRGAQPVGARDPRHPRPEPDRHGAPDRIGRGPPRNGRGPREGPRRPRSRPLPYPVQPRRGPPRRPRPARLTPG